MIERRGFLKGLLASVVIAPIASRCRAVVDHLPAGFQAFTSHFRWTPSVAVKDWRYVTRLVSDPPPSEPFVLLEELKRPMWHGVPIKVIADDGR